MKKLFKNEATGEQKELEVENRYKRVITDETGKWVAVPRPKYQSRASRRDDTVSSLQASHDELEDIVSQLQALPDAEDDEEVTEEDKQTRENLLLSARVIVEGIDWGEVESLQEELESWKSGMEGTNLENTEKYQMLDEASSTLGEVVDSLNSLSVDINDVDDIEQVVSDLDDAIGNLENVEFPGMF